MRDRDGRSVPATRSGRDEGRTREPVLATDLAEAAAGLLPLPGLPPLGYAVAHAAFEARSTQRQVLGRWLTGQASRSRGALSVLSVGCGDGTLDVRVAAALAAERREPVRYDGLDPHAPSAAAFLARVGGLAGVQAGAHVGDAGSPPAGPYDLVLAVHSLSYVDNLAGVLGRLRGLLVPGGELVVVLAPLAGLNALAGCLAPATSGHRQWWSEDLADALVAAGLDAERTRLHGRLSLDDCLDAGSPAGRRVLDFTVQAVLPDRLRAPVLAQLQALALPGPGLAVDHPADAWVVRA